jgi:type III secretion protein W
MGVASREFSKEGLGSPTALRDMYRDLTGNPREPLKLFEELSGKFPYDRLKTAIQFLLHALGADLRSKGPSIPRAELKRLIDDVRSLQGVLGVYRYFKEGMRQIQNQFGSYDLAMPARLTFDAIAKQFMKFIAERFISPEKILQSAKQLGISEETLAQIIVYTQMRDALKQVTPRFFKNQKHREDLFETFLKTLEDLEEKLEEEEEE